LPGDKAPRELIQDMHADDFHFCEHFSGRNIVVTGATGTIGSKLVDTILKTCRPMNLALFVRDD